MKGFKGTPGPWKWHDGIDCIVSGDNESLVVELLITGDTTANQDDANIDLIASSPDLLSALQQLVEIYDCTDGRVWTTSSKRRALDAAHAAIKKALGEK